MTIRAVIGAALICLGVVVVLIAALGLFRFKETLDLIHAGALADTMGVFLVLAGVMVLWGVTVASAKLVLALVILWVTNPVSAHLIARMELVTGRGIEPDTLPGEGEQEL